MKMDRPMPSEAGGFGHEMATKPKDVASALVRSFRRERGLHRMVDEPSEAEAEDALRAMIARRERKVTPQVVLSDDEAQRFLDALENPAASEPGLRRLVDRPRVIGA
jgi:Protein of unknown function (DUF1778)